MRLNYSLPWKNWVKFTVLYSRNYKSLLISFSISLGLISNSHFSYLVVIGVTDSLQDLAPMVSVLAFPSEEGVPTSGRLTALGAPGFRNCSYPPEGADVVVVVEVLDELLILPACSPRFSCPPLPPDPEPRDEPLDPLPPVGTTDTSG